MSEGLRAEDVKEALETWDEYKGFVWQSVPDEFWAAADRAFAAARLWLASQEQTPDYQAAAQTTEELLQGAYAWDIMPDLLARAIVDAALVGFHPQPEGESDAVQ